MSYPYALRFSAEDVLRLAQPAAIEGPIVTPWRVVIASPDLNGLVNSDIISNLAPPPDPALFPVADAKAAYTAVLGATANGLQYSVSEGYLPLRLWIARHMGTLGVPCDADNIVITCGSQQGLDLLGKLLLAVAPVK